MKAYTVTGLRAIKMPEGYFFVFFCRNPKTGDPYQQISVAPVYDRMGLDDHALLQYFAGRKQLKQLPFPKWETLKDALSLGRSRENNRYVRQIIRSIDDSMIEIEPPRAEPEPPPQKKEPPATPEDIDRLRDQFGFK